MSLLAVAAVVAAIIVVWLIVFALMCGLCMRAAAGDRAQKRVDRSSPWLGDVEWLWPPERRR